MSDSQAPNRVNGIRRKFSGLSAHPKYLRASSLFSPQAPISANLIADSRTDVQLASALAPPLSEEKTHSGTCLNKLRREQWSTED